MHWALGASLALHAALLTVRLVDPDAFDRVFEEQPLDVVLVNARSEAKPKKARAIAQKIYGAADVSADAKVRAQLKKLEEDGYGHYPVCIAKTQYSFSTDPNAKGAPSGLNADAPTPPSRLLSLIRREAAD